MSKNEFQIGINGTNCLIKCNFVMLRDRKMDENSEKPSLLADGMDFGQALPSNKILNNPKNKCHDIRKIQQQSRPEKFLFLCR